MRYYLLWFCVYNVLQQSLQDKYYSDVNIGEKNNYGMFELRNLNTTQGKVHFEGFWEELPSADDNPAPQIKFIFVKTTESEVIDVVYLKPRKNTKNYSRGYVIDFYIRKGLVEKIRLRPDDTYRAWCCLKSHNNETAAGEIQKLKIVGTGPRFVMFRLQMGREIYEHWEGGVESTVSAFREYTYFKDDNTCPVELMSSEQHRKLKLDLTDGDAYEE